MPGAPRGVHAPAPGPQRLSGPFWRASPIGAGTASPPQPQIPHGLRRIPGHGREPAPPASPKKTCSLTHHREQTKNGPVPHRPCRSHHYPFCLLGMQSEAGPLTPDRGSSAKVTVGLAGLPEGSLRAVASARCGTLPQPTPSPALPGAVKGIQPAAHTRNFPSFSPPHPKSCQLFLPAERLWHLASPLATKAAPVARTMTSPDQHRGSHQLSPLSGHSLETSQKLSYLKCSHDHPFPRERNPASAHRPGAFLPHADLSSPACSSNSEWCPA